MPPPCSSTSAISAVASRAPARARRARRARSRHRREGVGRVRARSRRAARTEATGSRSSTLSSSNSSGRIAGDRLQLGERPGESFPQAGKRCCVALTLPTRDDRSHSAILQRRRSSPSSSGSTAQRRSAVAPPCRRRPLQGDGLGATVTVRPWGSRTHWCLSSTTTTALRMLCRVNLELEGIPRARSADGRAGPRAAPRRRASTSCSSTCMSGQATGSRCSGEIGAERRRSSPVATRSTSNARLRCAVLRKPFTLTDLSSIGRSARS